MKLIIPAIAIISILGVGALVISQSPKIQNSETNTNTKSSFQANTDPKECSGKLLVELTEGPYYKSGTPQRQKIAEPGTPGEHLILKGYVLNTNCDPISGAWLDFWQADGDGNYDNEGYNLRGHQYTDKNGFFQIETVVPTRYTGRTEHIHFKVRKSENSPVITSQLFFPQSQTNSTDSIFDESLVVGYGTDPDGSKFASYNIIVP